MSQLKYYDTGSGQWLPVLAGAQGTTGLQGLTGSQGLQGTTGLQGTQGLQGLLSTVVYDSDQGVLSQQVFG
jgi:hypothetical protein